ncbi:MAG: cupin domain-containing protein [Candidatus Hodarchaeota archaeon]
MKGEGKTWLGDKVYTIKPGMIVQIPAGEQHGYKNTGEEELMLLTINIPF